MHLRNAWFLLAAIVFLFSNCGGSPTEPSDYEFGRADVYVKDGSGTAINGVMVRLERRNGEVEDPGGQTGSVGLPGYYFFLRTSGDFRIVITPPAGYTLAPGQTASRDFTFRRNQAETVNFVLQQT